MKGLRFLFFIFFWLAFLAIIIMAIYFKDYYTIIEEIKENKDLVVGEFNEKVKSNFVAADKWNYIIILIFVSFLLLLFAVNDLVLRIILRRFIEKIKSMSFFLGGFVWIMFMLLASLMVFGELVIITNAIAKIHSSKNTHFKPQSIEDKKIVFLLGTNKHIRGTKSPNLYYQYRIDAVNELYKAGKVKRIIISGDNSHPGYNEPADMKADLMRKGVPEHIIDLDFAGFRTLDSIVRLRQYFNVSTDVVIVSQLFHVQRALLLAWFYGIDAIAYPAKGTMTSSMIQRELFAKPKVFLDIFLFNMQPKFGRAPQRTPFNFDRLEHKLILGATIIFFIVSLYSTRKALSY